RRGLGRAVHLALAELDPLPQARERLVVGGHAPLGDRDAVRQLVDVAVGAARLAVALALAPLEARRRDLDPAREDERVQLDAGDVLVVEGRRQRPERRPGMEARLHDQQALVERDKRMAEAPAETEEDVLVCGDLTLDLAPDTAAEDLESAGHLLAGSLDCRVRCLANRRAYLQGDDCPFAGPLWSWFLSPQPQPPRVLSSLGGGVGVGVGLG